MNITEFKQLVDKLFLKINDDILNIGDWFKPLSRCFLGMLPADACPWLCSASTAHKHINNHIEKINNVSNNVYMYAFFH